MTADQEKYEGLEMSPQARDTLLTAPRLFASLCNGVGSEVGTWWQRLLYRITPNTIWGMDITPASDIHDVEYTVPNYFASKFVAEEYRHESDMRFRRNIEKLADRGWRILRAKRKARARAYYYLLRQFGAESFYAGKKLPHK
jgi:hypothetical protein